MTGVQTCALPILVEKDSLIEYDGPRDAVEMYADPRFVSIARTGRGTMAVRVRIPDWQASYQLLVNDEIIDPGMLAKIIDRAGIAEGLGNIRALNVVLFGALVEAMKLDEIEWEPVISALVKPAFRDLNLRAYRAGREARLH